MLLTDGEGSKEAVKGTRVNIHRAAHHQFPHNDAEGIDIRHLMEAVVPFHFRSDIEGGALLHVALMAPVMLHPHRHAKVDDFWFHRTGL